MGVISNVKVKSMNDYEAEILHMRSEMEHLQIKLSEAERRLQFSSNNNSQPQQIPTPTPGEFKIPEIPEIPDQIQKMAKEVVQRLTEDEEKLRNDFVLALLQEDLPLVPTILMGQTVISLNQSQIKRK
jgi:hypothetical protein